MIRRTVRPVGASARAPLGAVPALLGALALGLAVAAAPAGGQGGAQTFSEPLVWERLLERGGLDVRSQERPFASGGLREGAVIVTLDGRLPPAERDALIAFVRRGGRVLAAGATATPLAEGLGLRPRPVPSGPLWRRVRAAPETRASATLDVRTEPRAWRLRPAPGARSLYLDEEDRVGAVAVRAGRGVAVLVATSAFLGDRELLLADNAAFARASLGPRREVVIQTASAGAGGSGGSGDAGDGGGGGGGGQAPGGGSQQADGGGGGGGPEEDPGSLPLALMFGLLTAAAFVWSGRRLGPPTPPPVDADPARGVYAEAVGTALAETGDATGAVAGAREAARRALLGGVYGGTGGGVDEADPAALHAAALRAGLPADEADAVVGTPGHDPLAVGRALARLEGAT